MTSMSRKTGLRPLGTIRQPLDSLNHDRISYEKLVKKGVPTSLSTNNIDSLSSKKPQIPSYSSDIIVEQPVKPDHVECLERIHRLQTQLELLKQTNLELNSQLEKNARRLSDLQLTNDTLLKENLILKSEYGQCQMDKATLETKFNNLTNEFIASRDEWIFERERLQKCLNDIKKELENKIIDLRNKHAQEVELFEEKIRVLKTHLADTLNLRSIERQYELDRISEELSKSQSNEEHLRIRLNKLVDKLNTNGRGDTCEHCKKPLTYSKIQPAIKDQTLDKVGINFDKSKFGTIKSADQKH